MKRLDRNMTIIRKAVEATYDKSVHKKAVAEIVENIGKTRLSRGNDLQIRLYIDSSGYVWFEITDSIRYIPVLWRSLESDFLPLGFEEE